MLADRSARATEFPPPTIVAAADGAPTANEAQLCNVIEGLAPGDSLRLEIWRAAKEETLVVRLGRPPG